LQYIGVDISHGACARAQERLRNADLQGDIIVSDAFGSDMMQIVTSLRSFDLVNCQFAMHYSFDDVAHARNAMRVASAALKDGGVFIGTVADGDKLDARRQTLGKKFGDRYFRVVFEEREARDFGDAYAFTFNGAVENLTEYVTRKDTFANLATEMGLKIEMWENMSSLASRLRHDYPELWSRMGCTEIVDVTSLYVVFACIKVKY
jgi:mRNA (guanine-N7-)-methyltransferase